MILLQIYFEVATDKCGDFKRMYEKAYVPALRKQQGFIHSRLLTVFPDDMAREIDATPTEFNCQLELVFDTEENRRKWAASAEHQHVWPLAEGMARQVAWRGYDLAGDDRGGRRGVRLGVRFSME